MIGVGIGIHRRRMLSFDPRTISDLGLWLKADAGITLVGGAVDAWADQSGNARDFSAPAGSNRPAYSGTLNGRPVVTFDGSSDHLSGNAASLDLARNVPGLTMIAVVKYATGVSQRSIAISAGNNAARALLGVSATQWQVGGKRLDSDPVTNVSGGTVNNNYVVHSGVLRYSLATAATFVDEVSQVDTSFLTAGNTSNIASLQTFIGASSTGTTGFLSGDIAELLVYRRAITSEERDSVRRYLAARWGVNAAL